MKGLQKCKPFSFFDSFGLNISPVIHTHPGDVKIASIQIHHNS